MPRSQYRFFCNGELIGFSDLGSRDPDMGVASGQFTPAHGYSRVQGVFRLFAKAQSEAGPPDEGMLAKYYQARDQLGLTVETEAGVVVPTDIVHITDFRDEIDESACEVEVHVTDPAFFE